MMSEKKFKVGDRVRVTRDCKCGPFETFVKEGSEGGVCDIDKGYRDVDIDGLDDTVWIHISNLELAEPTDPRTAFLQELKELLSKYGASITSVAVYSDDHWVEAYIGYELVASSEGKSVDFTADNITDYEK